MPCVLMCHHLLWTLCPTTRRRRRYRRAAFAQAHGSWTRIAAADRPGAPRGGPGPSPIQPCASGTMDNGWTIHCFFCATPSPLPSPRPILSPLPSSDLAAAVAFMQQQCARMQQQTGAMKHAPPPLPLGAAANQNVSQGLTTGFWLPGERTTQPSRPQAPPRPLGEPQMPGRGLSQNNSDNAAFL